MRLLPAALAALILIGCSGATVPSATARGPEPKILEFLGPDLVALLRAPVRVSSYRVSPERAEPAHARLSGHPVLEVGPRVSGHALEHFRRLLFRDASHVWGIQKRCAFLPDTGLLFQGETDSAVVLISTTCARWAFHHGGRELSLDVADVGRDLELWTRALFPE